MDSHSYRNRSIVTSASNKFFPSLLNLIGSIKKHDPDHPHIYVYDLGLFPTYKAEIRSIPNVSLIEMPQFTTFWRKCYTWKTYIFKNPLTDVTLYLDAGNEVLKPLAPLFERIEHDGYLAVAQHIQSSAIIPEEYVSLFGVPPAVLEKKAITAGIFGFDKRNADVWNIIGRLHDASLSGLCLGYSASELWKNKAPNRNFFVRGCPHFRHDTTLLTILLYLHLPGLEADDTDRFTDTREQISRNTHLWNLRMNYDRLSNIGIRSVGSHAVGVARMNRMLVHGFFLAKRTNRSIKSIMLGRNIFAPAFGNELNATMDSFHDYPGVRNGMFSNIRQYHHQKAFIIKRFVQEHADADGSFLDAGAGAGPYSHMASPLFKNVYAYEFDANELDKARVNLRAKKNVELGAVDLRKIPLEDESIDTLVCSEVLEHIEGEHRAAAELYRVMKQGSLGLLSMPNRDSLFYLGVRKGLKGLITRQASGEELSYADWERIRHVSFGSKDIERIALDAGFTIRGRHGANLLPLPTKVREPLMRYAPALFYVWIRFERILSRALPHFCSFYFIEIEK